MKKCFSISVIFLVSLLAKSQDDEKAIQKGNEYYRLQQFEKAAVEYNRAVAANPANGTAKFNLANSLQKQGKQEEALKEFSALIEKTTEKDLKSKSSYNKGVVLTGQKKTGRKY